MELKESYLSCLQQSSLPIQNPLTVNKGMALVDVVSLLNTNINKHSCVLVEEKGQLLGLITERDLVKLAANGQDLREITVDTVMTKNLITMKASEAKDIFTVIKKLRCHHSRNLPILDNNNKIVGVVTVNSILTFLKPADILKYRQIAEVMSKNVIYTDGHTSLTDIAKLMATHKISCVVIGEKNNNQQVIARGIITERDIVRLHAQGLPFDELQAQTVMSTPLKMVQPEESLWSIQVHMQQHRIRRLAVGNSQGELLGIVTETDLVRAVDLTTLQNIVEILQEEVEELKDEKIKLLNRLNQELQIEVNQSKTKLQAEQEKEHLLASVALRIRQSVSLQTILQNTVTEVRQLLDNERVVISRYNCDGTHQVVVESVNKCELSLLGETPAIVGINFDQIQLI